MLHCVYFGPGAATLHPDVLFIFFLHTSPNVASEPVIWHYFLAAPQMVEQLVIACMQAQRDIF